MQTEFNILDRFRGIDLAQMDSIKLMNRTDTKYLTDINTLKDILMHAQSCGYLVFDISGKRVQDYKSLYYDSPALQMYLDHHNRKLVRQKLRTRCYGITGQTFLELKTKNNHGRTKKKRIEIESGQYYMNELSENQIVEWLNGKISYPIDNMTPTLETVFNRITLINPEMTERSTIDFNLSFNNVANGKSAEMTGLAIIEVMQDGNNPSQLREIMRELRVKPIRISKYCVGIAMTDNSAKSGRFKQKILLINKMKNRI